MRGYEYSSGDEIRKCQDGVWLGEILECRPDDGSCSKNSQGCCTVDHPCDIGQGDCDVNEQCIDDLVCGENNCDGMFFSNLDCCTSSEPSDMNACNDPSNKTKKKFISSSIYLRVGCVVRERERETERRSTTIHPCVN